jgi:hypothetical protein
MMQNEHRTLAGHAELTTIPHSFGGVGGGGERAAPVLHAVRLVDHHHVPPTVLCDVIGAVAEFMVSGAVGLGIYASSSNTMPCLQCCVWWRNHIVRTTRQRMYPEGHGW